MYHHHHYYYFHCYCYYINLRDEETQVQTLYLTQWYIDGKMSHLGRKLYPSKVSVLCVPVTSKNDFVRWISYG